ncbi:MAG: CpsD/CapB family tyrosine-protein kinase [Thermodesulfovibrionales bacterium]|nr:CpsD/CapB family tyrosine-protein kinase [Thermodesulfovibrionales bacterium]
MMDINQTLLEETLGITMQLSQVRQNRPIQSLLVTSAEHGEGKTTVASTLAVALAMKGRASVLLIDANIRTPNIHELLGLDLSNGFIDFIGGRADMISLIKDTAYPHLKVMTAGKLDAENTIPLLSAMPSDTKKAIEKDFEWVIYDTSPVNSSPETLLTITLADYVILVIRAEKTRWQSVEKAKGVLESVGANILGAVLNSQKNYIPRVLYERF